MSAATQINKAMTRGKNICNQLKAVRRSIAEENGIALEIPECTHKGPCPGTCPRCESEVQYLETELEKRVRMGKVATVAGLALGLASCGTGPSPAAVDSNDLVENEAPIEAPELIDPDSIPPPPDLSDSLLLQLSGIVEEVGFVVDTLSVQPEMLEHLPNATEPSPDDWYDDHDTTASCNPLDKPVVRGESGAVTATGGVRRRTQVLVPVTPNESRAEAEREDARRALPPVVTVDEVDGVKIINNDEPR